MSDPDGAPTRTGRPPTRENQREFILDTALALIAERGASTMSMRQLANACDLNVAALYHYFDSKDALVAAVVEERRYGARMADVPPLDPSAPVVERLRTMFAHIWAGALAEEPIWRVLLGEGTRREPSTLPVGRELLDMVLPGIAEWIRREIPEVGRPDDVATILVGQLFVGFVRHIFEPDLDTNVILDRVGTSLAALGAT
ncbi:MAG: TetR/AcrR family transcriptional regulator [Microthrixaceae bacterium]